VLVRRQKRRFPLPLLSLSGFLLYFQTGRKIDRERERKKEAGERKRACSTEEDTDKIQRSRE
jgi:hypothetical protein